MTKNNTNVTDDIQERGIRELETVTTDFVLLTFY